MPQPQDTPRRLPGSIPRERPPVNASVFVGISLDGFIARMDGGLDFLPDVVEPHGYDEFMASVDALVIGRKTFETVLGFGTWPYGEKPVFVLSMRPLPPTPPGAVIEHMSAAHHVAGRRHRRLRRLRRHHPRELPRRTFQSTDAIDNEVVNFANTLAGGLAAMG